MTTGRIDYSPDYNSHCGMAFPASSQFCGKCGASLEKARLEREVVEAAKQWRQGDPESQQHLANYARLAAAVDALLEFEATQEKK